MTQIIFPTELHRQATEVITTFFLEQKHIDTILLVNSLARGKATPESDIDIAILATQTITKKEIETLEGTWLDFLNTNPTLSRYINSDKFAQIHLDIIEGVFEPAIWEDGGAIDPVAVYRASGYRQKVGAVRPAVLGAGGGIV